MRLLLGLKLDLSTDRSVGEFKGRPGIEGTWGESAGFWVVSWVDGFCKGFLIRALLFEIENFGTGFERGAYGFWIFIVSFVRVLCLIIRNFLSRKYFVAIFERKEPGEME